MTEPSSSSVPKKSNFLRTTGFLLLLFAAVAFALKAIVHPERLARYTPWVIVHGVLLLAWLALFWRQARLIAAGRIAAHSVRGKWSWLLVVTAIVVSWAVAYSLMREFKDGTVLVANTVMLVGFGGFFIAAIAAIRRRDGATHKRYMLFACLSILLPPIGRIANIVPGPDDLISLLLFIAVVLVIPLAYDRRTIGAVHKATKRGLVATFAGLVLMMVAVSSPLPAAIVNLSSP